MEAEGQTDMVVEIVIQIVLSPSPKKIMGCRAGWTAKDPNMYTLELFHQVFSSVYNKGDFPCLKD